MTPNPAPERGRPGFVSTLGASLLELLDEALVFVGGVAAVVAGLYFSNWWVFGAVLLGAFGLGAAVRRIARSSVSAKSGTK